MKCPYCGDLNSRVIDSRLTPGEFSIRRRRECQSCTRRFTTFEKVEQVPVVIVKKDGRREEFDRAKVLSGIKKACEKRAVSVEKMENVVDVIERDFRQGSAKEVFSKVVGEKVMARLHGLDDVAYVRFASVYREFKDVADFIDELKSLAPDRKKDPADPGDQGTQVASEKKLENKRDHSDCQDE